MSRLSGKSSRLRWSPSVCSMMYFTIDFDTEDKPDIPVYNPEMSTAAAAPKISLNPGYNPFKSSSSTGAVPMGASFSVPKSKPQVDEKWEQLYEGLKDQDDAGDGNRPWCFPMILVRIIRQTVSLQRNRQPIISIKVSIS